MSKTIYVIFKTARQEMGEYVFISAEKAFIDKSRAEEFWRQQLTIWKDKIEGVDCVCERGVHEVELVE